MNAITSDEFEAVLRELGATRRAADRPLPAKPGHDLRILEDLLNVIPADTSRGDGSIPVASDTPPEGYWFGIMLAAHRDWGEDAKPALQNWSRRSDRYSDDGFEQAWAAFDPDHENPITSKSIFRLAECFGWTTPPPEPCVSRYRLLDRGDILALPPMNWRVKGIFPQVGIAAIYGPSMSGKSFLALDLAMAIGRGAGWFDNKTECCPVTYLMLEGEAGAQKRIKGWESYNRRQIPSSFALVTQAFDLTKQQDIRDLAASVPEGGVIIIDTLNRAASGMDENASADMGRVIDGIKLLQSLTCGLVVVVHHTGKDASKGLRGHSSLLAALDGAIEVKRSGKDRAWSSAKVKDGSDDRGVAFVLEEVFLSFDSDGDSITSCAVAPELRSVSFVKEPTGPRQKLVMNALRNTERTSIPFDEAVEIASGVLTGKTAPAIKGSAKVTLKGLIKRGHLSISGTELRL